MRPATDACEASRTSLSTSSPIAMSGQSCWNTFSPAKLPEFDLARLQKSTSWLSNDLRRQAEPGLNYQDSVQVAVGKGASVTVPILATRKDGKHFAIALSGPLTTGHPADANLLQLPKTAGAPELIIVNELLVRAHLPAATREVELRTAL